MNDLLKKHEFTPLEIPAKSKVIAKADLPLTGFKPAKWMGQNFLIDRGVLKKIVEAGELNKDDVIVEVGPGFGALTFKLAERAKKVIAAEKDKNLAKILKERLLENKISNVQAVEGDILKFNPNVWKLEIENWKLLGNIPYYITAPLIRKFLESKRKPSIMVLMVQKEVAQRICAKPAKNQMSLLAVSVQFYAEPKIIAYVSKKSFRPSPKVDSAIIKIVVKKPKDLPKIDSKLFFKIVKAGFAGKRKQLINTLSRGLGQTKEQTKQILAEAGIQPVRRAESLSLEEWLALAKNFQFLISNF